VLRNWEKTYQELKPKKNSAGNRAYTDEDVALIFKIKELVEDQKFTSDGVKKVLKEMDTTQGLPTQTALTPEMRKDLTEVRIFMNQLLQKL
jgi:DNA-binding transcriptional MerR regulator